MWLRRSRVRNPSFAPSKVSRLVLGFLLGNSTPLRAVYNKYMTTLEKQKNETLTINRAAIFFVPAIYLVLHTLEELPGFGAWVEVNFGSHPTSMFAWQHIIIWLFVFLVCYKAYQKKRHGKWVILAVTAQIQFGLNAIFHLTTYFVLGTYSPGMVVAGAIGIPATVWFVRQVLRERRVTLRELAWAVLWGTLIAAAAIGVLFLP